MPTVTERTIDAWASCHDARCPGYKQEPVKAIETLTEYTYFDLGGDIPGVERSTTMLRFEELADAQCAVCGEPRLIADQVRPIYPNMSGQPQDTLLQMHTGGERLREMELKDARREAEMAQMRATMERQQTLIERLVGEQAPPRSRPRSKDITDQ
jgi:hypothetical protein